MNGRDSPPHAVAASTLECQPFPQIPLLQHKYCSLFSDTFSLEQHPL